MFPARSRAQRAAHGAYAGLRGRAVAATLPDAPLSATPVAIVRPPARRAPASSGLRIAFVGKGGAGKTVLASTLARLLARRGRRVLAVDMDTSPGLSYSIGLSGKDVSLPRHAIEESPAADYGWQLRSDLTAAEAVERYAVRGPDGVAVLSVAKHGSEGDTSPPQTLVAMREVLRTFAEPGWDVVCDLEAGLTTPYEGFHSFADDVVVVVGAAWRSAMTVRRLMPMIDKGQRVSIVANRFRSEPDHEAMVPRARVPFDPAVADAERHGLAPIDACPSSPVMRAIERLADLLTSPAKAP